MLLLSLKYPIKYNLGNYQIQVICKMRSIKSLECLALAIISPLSEMARELLQKLNQGRKDIFSPIDVNMLGEYFL